MFIFSTEKSTQVSRGTPCFHLFFLFFQEVQIVILSSVCSWRTLEVLGHKTFSFYFLSDWYADKSWRQWDLNGVDSGVCVLQLAAACDQNNRFHQHDLGSSVKTVLGHFSLWEVAMNRYDCRTSLVKGVEKINRFGEVNSVTPQISFERIPECELPYFIKCQVQSSHTSRRTNTEHTFSPQVHEALWFSAITPLRGKSL